MGRGLRYRPGRERTPDATSFATRPGTTWPIWWVRANWLPRVFLCGLQREGYALAVQVDVEHFDGDLLTDLDDLTADGRCAFQDSSDTCTSPSTPPRSTNAPKLTMEETDTGTDGALLTELVQELAAHPRTGVCSNPGATGTTRHCCGSCPAR